MEATVADLRAQLDNCLRSIALLRENNRKIKQDNEELTELCCFLDDDRQKGRKLAKEWQKFGRYTAKVMKQEVSSYQAKLKQLDMQQKELLKDNRELKDLCLYLDEERNHLTGQVTCPACRHTFVRETRSSLSEPLLSKKVQNVNSHHSDGASSSSMNTTTSTSSSSNEAESISMQSAQSSPSSTSSEEVRRPFKTHFNAIEEQEDIAESAKAIKVFEVYEDAKSGNLKDMSTESAIIQEMCNVVWKSLSS